MKYHTPSLRPITPPTDSQCANGSSPKISVIRGLEGEVNFSAKLTVCEVRHLIE